MLSVQLAIAEQEVRYIALEQGTLEGTGQEGKESLYMVLNFGQWIDLWPFANPCPRSLLGHRESVHA